MATGEVIGNGNPDGSTFGNSASELISFYNVTPVAQPADAVQATITVSWVTLSGGTGFGIDTSDHMVSLIATFKHIQYVLKTLGLWKGAA